MKFFGENPFGLARDAASKHKEKTKEDSLISRRNLLRGAVGIAGMSLMEGCAPDHFFTQNFDATSYQPFNEDERLRRTEKPFTKQELTRCYAEHVREFIDVSFPFEQLFDVQSTADGGAEVLPVKSDDEMIVELEAFGYQRYSGGWIDTNYFLVAKQLQDASLQTHVNAEPNSISMTSWKDSNLQASLFGYVDHDHTVADENAGPLPVIFSASIAKPMTDAVGLSNVHIRESSEGVKVFSDQTSTQIQMPTKERITLSGRSAFKQFLETCTSNMMIQSCLKTINPELCGIHDIETIEQLVELFWLLPERDPISYGHLLKCGFTYAARDTSSKDECRNPVDSFRSGWGDCDDFAVVHYLWAQLEGLEPHLLHLAPGESGEIGHLFVMCTDSVNQKAIFLDNSNVTIVPLNYDALAQYISTTWKGRTLDFDKRY